MRNKGNRVRKRKGISDLNITPMVDVMFSLLVVFMVTAPLLTTGIPLDLPKSDGKLLPGESKTINVSVDKEGGTFIGTDKIPLNSLITKIDLISKENPNADIVISADTGVPYGYVIEIMGMLRLGGYSKIGLKTDSSKLIKDPKNKK